MARMLSLKKDKNDDTQFRHGYQRHVGDDTGDITGNGTFHYGQNCPYFFTYEGATVSLDGMYKGASAFLVGSGPSLVKEQYNKLKMPGVLTFGMNNSAKIVRPNMWTCVDDPCRFLYSVWMDPSIMKFVPQASFEKPIWDSTVKDGKQQWRLTKTKVGDCPNVFGYRRNEKFHAPRFFTENTINWGCHREYGGCRSVMLAAIRIMFILGIRRIYLAGVDLKMDEENKYSFAEGRTKGAIKNNQNTYNRMLTDYFPKLKQEAEKWGLEIICCNAESDLCKIFSHRSFEDAIKDVTYDIGDITQEKTEGMYLAQNEKQRHKTWEACAKATGAI
jgi:hypothetical protein